MTSFGLQNENGYVYHNTQNIFLRHSERYLNDQTVADPWIDRRGERGADFRKNIYTPQMALICSWGSGGMLARKIVKFKASNIIKTVLRPTCIF